MPARIVEFERVEQVIDALRSGEADMTITNASAARAALVDFTEPLVALELGYLVMPGFAGARRSTRSTAVGRGRYFASQATRSALSFTRSASRVYIMCPAS